MSKYRLITALAVSAFALGACGNDEEASEPETEEVSEAETEEQISEDEEEISVESTNDLPTEEIGEGNFYIVNASGSSEDTDVVEFYDDELLTPYLGVEGWDMDGSHKTFIYFNGELVAEEQLSDTQTSIDIPQDQYKVGTHTVSAIQYDDNTESGEPIFVRNINFEIQE